LSGASIYFALGYRTAGQFLQERCVRLLIPLVFGIFILSPPQVYLERLSNPNHGVAPWNGELQFSGSFWEFMPYYFQGWYLFGGNFAWMGIHLWYLLALFLFSLLMLPVFLMLRQNQGQHLIEKLAIACKNPAAIFLLALPIAAFESGLNPTTLGVRIAGGWNLFTYLMLLLYGYLLVADRRMQQTIHHYGVYALTIAVLTTPLFLGQVHDMPVYGSSNYVLLMTLRSFNSWCWMIAFLYLSGQFLNFNHMVLRYTSEASLPFYILHQPIIVVIGFFIGQWQIGVLPKFLMLSLAAFIAIALIYELFVRRISLLRFFFGLKPSVNF
jgi:hypothetical protein